MMSQEEEKKSTQLRSAAQMYGDIKKLYPINDNPNYELDRRRTKTLNSGNQGKTFLSYCLDDVNKKVVIKQMH